MAEKKTNKNTVEVVETLAKPIAEQLQLSLWNIRFVKEGSYWYLRIFIDKKSGVTIEDCEMFSHAISDALDRVDPIDHEYCLEVSSPGLNRELTRPWHFKQYLGEQVIVKMIRPFEGEHEIKGTLNGFNDGMLQIQTDHGSHTISQKDTSWVHVYDESLDDIALFEGEF